MIKTGLPLFALLGAVAFGGQVLSVQPAHAQECMETVAMVKEEAMAADAGDAKDMALKHIAMAEEKAGASMEDDCMSEVSMAKDALAGKDSMASDGMASDDKAKTN